MRYTEKALALQKLLDERTALDNEIAHWRGIAATAAAKRESVISDDAALTDSSLYDSASRYQQQSAGASRKADQLESGLPALDEKLSDACNQVTKELCDHLDTLKADRFLDFKNRLGKFWSKGTADQWFNPYPHAPRPIPAKVAFEQSDSSGEIVQAVARVLHANTPSAKKTPSVRGAKLLELIPTLPSAGTIEPAPENSTPPEPPAEKPTTTEPEKKSWWFKPKLKSLLSGNTAPAQA